MNTHYLTCQDDNCHREACIDRRVSEGRHKELVQRLENTYSVLHAASKVVGEARVLVALFGDQPEFAAIAYCIAQFDRIRSK